MNYLITTLLIVLIIATGIQIYVTVNFDRYFHEIISQNNARNERWDAAMDRLEEEKTQSNTGLPICTEDELRQGKNYKGEECWAITP